MSINMLPLQQRMSETFKPRKGAQQKNAAGSPRKGLFLEGRGRDIEYWIDGGSNEGFCIIYCGSLLLFCNERTKLGYRLKSRRAWHFAFDHVNGRNFMNKSRAGETVNGQQWSSMHQPRDYFEAYNRMHWQLDAFASEKLSGTVFLKSASSAGAWPIMVARSARMVQAPLRRSWSR